MQKFLLIKDNVELCTLVKPFGPLFGTLWPYAKPQSSEVQQSGELIYMVSVKPLAFPTCAPTAAQARRAAIFVP